MNRKKGFTLVELLAVIVILAVIAIIATPIVINMIESSREGAAVQNVNGILKAAENFFVNEALGQSNQETYNLDLTTANNLEYKGSKPNQGTLLIDATGNMSVIAKFGKYCVEKKFGNDEPKIIDNEQCKIDQTEVTNLNTYKENILNGAYPVLKDNLIPVTIANDGTVKKASLKQQWYQYENKVWANAVILSDKTQTYTDNAVIPESNIESYFVWIPRYRYKLWYTETNQNTMNAGIDESKVHDIEITFENKETTVSNGSHDQEWLTHPAFTSFNTNGLWVGKFETGYKGATSTASAQANANDSSKVQIKPNVYSWRSIQVANAFQSSYNYQRALDSHMMKNTEWGAVAYLSHSVYGNNKSIRLNNNSSFKTGYAAVKEPTKDYPEYNDGGTTEDKTLPYNTTTGYLASTSGNISGVYDMSGGAHEYVMGVKADTSGKPLSGRNKTYNSGFTGTLGCPTCDNLDGSTTSATGVAFPAAKYYDLYSKDSDWSKRQYRILGDATGEMGPFGSIVTTGTAVLCGTGLKCTRYISSWYGDSSWFASSSFPWFYRGNAWGGGSGAGVFAFNYSYGSAGSGIGFRLVLAV